MKTIKYSKNEIKVSTKYYLLYIIESLNQVKEVQMKIVQNKKRKPKSSHC